MLTTSAIAVLRALRGLAHENGAALTSEQTKKRTWSAAPTASQIAARSGVATSALAGLRDELVIEGAVTKLGEVHVVTIHGHALLDERAAAATPEAA